MSYHHEPIEEMLEYLENNGKGVEIDLINEDFYFPGDPFDQYRVIGDKYSFKFRQYGPNFSYVRVKDHDTCEVVFINSMDEFKAFLEQHLLT
jgi:hypothetical protein